MWPAEKRAHHVMRYRRGDDFLNPLRKHRAYAEQAIRVMPRTIERTQISVHTGDMTADRFYCEKKKNEPPQCTFHRHERLIPTSSILNGIAHKTILIDVHNNNNRPAKVMCIGEIHGKQDCGTGSTDYISAYKTFLHQNEISNNPEKIDVFLEVGNYNVKVDSGHHRWINILRTEFQDCYLYFEKCRYKHTRFHWSDPQWHGGDNWLTYIDDMPSFLEDDWKETYKRVAEHITSEKDLLKIIFEDPNIQKEGSRCSIKDWEKFVTEQHRMMLDREKEDWKILLARNKYFKVVEWWRTSISSTGRFKMDIFALLRMFRKDDHQGRFKNVIYHAGKWHTKNLALMLKVLSYEQLYDIYDDNNCMEVNLIDDFSGAYRTASNGDRDRGSH